MKQMMTAVALAALILVACVHAQSTTGATCPAVTAPPDSFFEKVRERDRDVAREFYQKYMDVKGLPLRRRKTSKVLDYALHA